MRPSKELSVGLAIASMLVAETGQLHADTLLSVDFDDGTMGGYTLPAGGGGDWEVQQPDGSAWTNGADGVLWQTNGTVSGWNGTYFVSTNVANDRFTYTALVHPVQVGSGTVRLGLVARVDTGGSLVPKLNLLWNGATLVGLIADNGGATYSNFTLAYGQDYTMQMEVDGSNVTGRLWSGVTTNGVPDVEISAVETVNFCAEGVGLAAAGLTAYFDDALLDTTPPPAPTTIDVLAADFDDGTSEGFVDPSPAGTPWAVLDKTGDPWTNGEDGALWQTDGATTRFGGDDVVFNDNIAGDNFTYTALVHPVADGAAGEQAFTRYGIFVRSGGNPVSKVYVALEEVTGGRLIMGADNGAMFEFDNAFNWSYGNDYILQLEVAGSNFTGRVWNGDTICGDPAAILTGTDSLNFGIEDDVGFTGPGGTVYFDSASVEVPMPAGTIILLK